MRCKIKGNFSIGGKSFKVGSEDEFTDDQVSRLSLLIEPIAINKNIELPPKDKMIGTKDVNKKNKKGGKNR